VVAISSMPSPIVVVSFFTVPFSSITFSRIGG
jgi:hypothetical protein